MLSPCVPNSSRSNSVAGLTQRNVLFAQALDLDWPAAVQPRLIQNKKVGLMRILSRAKQLLDRLAKFYAGLLDFLLA